MRTDSTPLQQLPAPVTVRNRMGQLYRELALLRRLLRLSQAARDELPSERSSAKEAPPCRD
jgi:hypothetical protein